VDVIYSSHYRRQVAERLVREVINVVITEDRHPTYVNTRDVGITGFRKIKTWFTSLLFPSTGREFIMEDHG
jgi:hypothetical protein